MQSKFGVKVAQSKTNFEVNLSSSNPDIASVQPSKVSLTPGENKAFDVLIAEDGSKYPDGATVKIKASYGDKRKTKKLNIEAQQSPPKPELTSLVLDPNPATWGQKVKGTVTLSSPAPDDGISINFKIDNDDFDVIELVKVEPKHTKARFKFPTPKPNPRIKYPKIFKVNITAFYREQEKAETLKLALP